ncbi:MAG: S8 family peptidase [Patescibacteria group bacterium]
MALPCLAAPVPPSLPTLVPDDLFWSRQWYLRQIHAPEAWAVTTGSKEIIVAMIDGGVDMDHQDLRGAFWTNAREMPNDGVDNDQNGYVDDVHGWNYVTDSPNVKPVWKEEQYEETWSHGTMVASLIAAKGNDGRGIAGVAWNVRLMPLVILGAEGEGQVDDLVKAVRYATNHGAQVINMSLAGDTYSEELEEMIRRAQDAGVVIVAATGNNDGLDGLDLDTDLSYPACFDRGPYRRLIGVGGTDTLDQKAPSANYGTRCTDIVAPGQEFFAARPSYPHGNKATSTVPGYVDGMTGTSLAAPLVTGAVVLLKSVHPEWTATQIRERLLQTADAIEDNLTFFQRNKMGAGRLNIGRALTIDRPVLVAASAPTSTAMTVTPPKQAKRATTRKRS